MYEPEHAARNIAAALLGLARSVSRHTRTAKTTSPRALAGDVYAHILRSIWHGAGTPVKAIDDLQDDLQTLCKICGRVSVLLADARHQDREAHRKEGAA